jgi:hypothetical protein
MLKALDYASLHGAAVKTMGPLRAYDLLRKDGDGVSISPSVAKFSLRRLKREELNLCRKRPFPRSVFV